MRRLVFALYLLVLLPACGPKKVQVNAPRPAPVSSSELEGLASYYAEPYHGRRTANGEIFDTYRELTAAHRTLPFNSFVRVTNKANGREVDVRINDRGPFIDGRVIDLSLRAAREIDMVRAGVTPVALKLLQPLATAGSAAFAVQVGAFEDPRAASDLKQQLERKYSGVMIQTVSQERTLYRVRIGQLDIEEANRVAAELRREDFNPFVVRLN